VRLYERNHCWTFAASPRPPHSSSFICRMCCRGQQYVGLTPPQRMQRTSAFATARGDKSEENRKYITYCVVIRRGPSYEHRYHTHIWTLLSHYFAPYRGRGARVTTLFNNDFPWLFHDQKNEFPWPIGTAYFFRNKRYTIYECLPE